MGFRTAELMDEALLCLLENKEFSYITIKEICKKAGVNRSTFYLHYENTADLLAETVEYLIKKFLDSFQSPSPEDVSQLLNAEKESLLFVKQEYLIPYLHFVKENRRVFKLAIEKAELLQMHKTYEKLFAGIIQPAMHAFKIPEVEQRYVATYYINGIIAIIELWMQDGCKDEIEWIATLIEKYVR